VKLISVYRLLNSKKLQQVIAPLILPSAVDSFFGHWPKKFKDGIERDLYTKLNDAEGEYSTCKAFFNDSFEIDASALISRLAMNVLGIAGYKIESAKADVEIIMLAKLIETGAMAKLVENRGESVSALISNFGCLVAAAGAARLPSGGVKSGRGYRGHHDAFRMPIVKSWRG